MDKSSIFAMFGGIEIIFGFIFMLASFYSLALLCILFGIVILILAGLLGDKEELEKTWK